MKNRKTESFGQKMIAQGHLTDNDAQICFCSSSDIGVRKNQGRNGARFAPKSILAALAKLNDHSSVSQFQSISLPDIADESINFEKAQYFAANFLCESIKKNHNQVKFHLGGGHDHVFPLLKAIDQSKKYDRIIVLNLDAHCDTRADHQHHSGTPFRNFDEDVKTESFLLQYGIELHSNSPSTLAPLKNISEYKHFLSEIKQRTQNLSLKDELILHQLKELKSEKTAFVFSLDCDALNAAEFPAVSAPNPSGLNYDSVQDLLLETKKIFRSSDFYFGIYEFNPVYDSLAGTCAKRLATLIYSLLLH